LNEKACSDQVEQQNKTNKKGLSHILESVSQKERVVECNLFYNQKNLQPIVPELSKL
jgi:hypothetical protein